MKQSNGISLRNVSKVYPDTRRPAVDAVSLDIADGEFMTFLGPSGSGKTTTLSMIAGFTANTSGSILLGGRDISRCKPHQRNLGVVFQHYALFPHMTARQNIAYPLRQRKLSKSQIARKVDDALELVSLGALGDRLPSQLSGGQQQRVALARAVVYEPDALLLDEPLGALDKKLRDGLQRQIARIHQELGITFIFVTHDQEEALTLSDRIAVFNEGLIEQVGTPHELYERPTTLFVAEFLGESNVFRGRVSSGGRIDCGTFATGISAHDAASGGSHAAIVVRPERLELVERDGAVPLGQPMTTAMVTDIRYLGNCHRIGLDYGDGCTGSSMQLVGAATVPDVGRTVTVTWSAQHHTVVPVPADGDDA
ncbi:polyamine ABC transporter ATP-binding protein [Mycobacterium sp. AT1]|nr:polyamine ABC transporter ATP-binding protein [Mycobacterium sp. AT1]